MFENCKKRILILLTIVFFGGLVIQLVPSCALVPELYFPFTGAFSSAVPVSNVEVWRQNIGSGTGSEIDFGLQFKNITNLVLNDFLLNQND